ncbi:hypothetical protein SORBI_3008G102050 [Sorghum bicolor]|uniref:Uncharacterized protein n=1 Tax=Sorghum bicolor TaxID=4558 RepID=A0A1Z5R608_SORBI|nr:hypothetical protein SORBI_3008G102050 [Sorghum bicolor]
MAAMDGRADRAAVGAASSLPCAALLIPPSPPSPNPSQASRFLRTVYRQCVHGARCPSGSWLWARAGSGWPGTGPKKARPTSSVRLLLFPAADSHFRVKFILWAMDSV